MKITVYMLSNSNGNYIGSTKQNLNQRISNHKCKYKNWLKNNEDKYCSSFNVIKDEFEVITLVELEVKDNLEQRKIEQYYINNNECINTNRAFQTEETRKEQKKKYRNKNKEQIKKYYEEHKEQIKDYQKEYQKENREKRNEKMNCVCGGKYIKKNQSVHFKSHKHQLFLNI